MKKISFKKSVFLLFLLFVGTSMNAQEDNLKFHSITFGFGLWDSPASETGGGMNFVADVATKQGKGIFSLYVNSADDFLSFNQTEKMLAGSLTYGRETNLLSWVKLEGHAGVGFFSHKYSDERDDSRDFSKTSIGIPLRAKLILFYKFFGLGINQNANFNPLAITYSTDLVLQIIF